MYGNPSRREDVNPIESRFKKVLKIGIQDDGHPIIIPSSCDDILTKDEYNKVIFLIETILEVYGKSITGYQYQTIDYGSVTQ